MSRKDLQSELNRLNEGYQKTKLDMEKLGATPAQMRQLANTRKMLEENLQKIYADDLTKLNQGQSIPTKGGTVSNAAMALDQSKVKDLAKTPLVGKESMFKKLTKKLGGKLGGAGKAVAGLMAGAAALDSGDVMAAIPGIASAVDRTGLVGAGMEAKRRMELKDPKELEELRKEDFRQALPMGLQDQAEFLYEEPRKPRRFNKIKEQFKK